MCVCVCACVCMIVCLITISIVYYWFMVSMFVSCVISHWWIALLIIFLSIVVIFVTCLICFNCGHLF